MRKVILSILAVGLLAGNGLADDLYHVTINSRQDARLLTAAGVEPLVWTGDGYLVLANDDAAEKLSRSALNATLLESNVTKDELALDGRWDNLNATRYPVLFERQGIRLLKVDPVQKARADQFDGLFSISNEYLTIEYTEPRPSSEGINVPVDGLDTLIERISQDSLQKYTERLQAFYRRPVGSDSLRAARDWIHAKFESFGYTGVENHLFYYSSIPCYNVIARKIGTVYPDRYIVVGAHYDGVSNSPAADDNGSGTAAVLEMARALYDIETKMSFVFVAFDAEEVGLVGSWDYATTAAAAGDDIVLMFNFDMIGDRHNDTLANLFYGAENAYAVLWSQLADSLVGIQGVLAGGSSRSDHHPFAQVGYDVAFLMEYEWSDYYHTSLDITAYMNFDYMHRMVQGGLATTYTVSAGLPPIRVTAIQEPGDGQSLIVNWRPTDPSETDYYRVGYYPSGDDGAVQYVDVPATDTTWLVEGLTDGQEYGFFVQVVDFDGGASVAFYHPEYATPLAVPRPPSNLMAMPLYEAVTLSWHHDVVELDFDHYEIFRDGSSAGVSFDTTFVDNDPSLGADFHSYVVAVVDSDGNRSDTAAITPFVMKAATLEPDRVMAINRSTSIFAGFVNEIETGVFLREALNGYNYDYFSDTAYTDLDDNVHLNLVDMVDYGVLVVGAEAGHLDDIGRPAYLTGGILDTLAYYLSIGGKVVVFGRWGDLGVIDTIDYRVTSSAEDNAYYDWFHIASRVITLSNILSPETLTGDLTAARSAATGYPDLPWDSLTTSAHSTPYVKVTGLPMVDYVNLASADVDVLYTYHSRTNDPLSEGRPVAWRYLGDDYKYVYFDIPLSFFDRDAAIVALQRSVDDVLNGTTGIDDPNDNGSLPESYVLRQNYPNPFNPSTTIEYTLPRAGRVELTVYNLLGQKVRTLVDEYQTAGSKSVSWDGTGSSGVGMATGLYFYRLTAGDEKLTRKMLLLK